jgi:pyruvoyl-dependent arginine decarboxylase (PvlArgDC)
MSIRTLLDGVQKTGLKMKTHAGKLRDATIIRGIKIKEIFKISGKIVSTRNITQSSIVQSHGFTTVIAVAVFIF